MINTRNRLTERVALQPLPIANEVLISRLILVLAIAGGAFLRIWEINAMGYNTDEAVYAGQAAAIASVPGLQDIFPVFRAHPLLFQFLLSVIYKYTFNDLVGRLLAAAFGLGTILLTYQIGKTMYGRIPGALAAAFLAIMPYHVIVSRQVLLDGPMVFFATLTLYMLARFGQTHKTEWLYAAGGCMGLTVLTKETSIIMMGAIYTFLALASVLKVRLRDLIVASLLMILVISPFPISLIMAGGSSTGRNYLVWQLFRRPNHEWSFYLTDVPPAVGVWLLVIAALGLIFLWRERSWKETLLLSWIAVPYLFFQVWPVKGFQYLLPIAPPVTLLAAQAIGKMLEKIENKGFPIFVYRVYGLQVVPWLVTGLIVYSMIFASWQRIQPETTTTFLAGTGGVPGGREAGAWIENNVPQAATFLTIGPSMANIIQFYGERRAFGVAVSPNPLHRNPSYIPINNPDVQIRRTDLQYLVWDSFSAARSPFFADKLLSYVNKYNGRAIHTESITVADAKGEAVTKPVIIIYEVHP